LKEWFRARTNNRDVIAQLCGLDRATAKSRVIARDLRDHVIKVAAARREAEKEREAAEKLATYDKAAHAIMERARQGAEGSGNRNENIELDEVTRGIDALLDGVLDDSDDEEGLNGDNGDDDDDDPQSPAKVPPRYEEHHYIAASIRTPLRLLSLETSVDPAAEVGINDFFCPSRLTHLCRTL
jgi:hypothetical protein